MVHGRGEVAPAHGGMSTTASVVLVVSELVIVGQVGDSRVYLARDGGLAATEDHLAQRTVLTPEQARRRPQAQHPPIAPVWDRMAEAGRVYGTLGFRLEVAASERPLARWSELELAQDNGEPSGRRTLLDPCCSTDMCALTLWPRR
jgi:hypothetical protein